MNAFEAYSVERPFRQEESIRTGACRSLTARVTFNAPRRKSLHFGLPSRARLFVRVESPLKNFPRRNAGRRNCRQVIGRCPFAWQHPRKRKLARPHFGISASACPNQSWAQNR